MTQTIFVLDDDQEICALLEHFLRQEGFVVQAVQTRRQLTALLAASSPDLILLDLMLPDGDGFTMAREIRESSQVPIIMLTGKTNTVDKVVGLEIGADDYVTKPFDRRELLARIRSVLRRANGEGNGEVAADEASILSFNGWKLDRTAQELTSPEEERVYLTSYEYRLLSVLAQHPNHALSRDQIMELLSERDWNPMDRSVDVLVGKLRKKLEQDPSDPRMIKTIRGIGYKFTATVQKD